MYTGLDNGNGDVVALTTSNLIEMNPVVSFYTITKLRTGTLTDKDEIEALMSITLAHELAHIYGIEGDPANDLVDDYGNKIHNVENGVVCIMNYMNIDQMKQYYTDMIDYFDDLDNGEETTMFCDHCMSILQEQIPTVIHYGN